MNPSSIRLAVAFFLASATALPASAASCGTFAAPTSCSVTIANVVKYTFSSFSVVSASGTGGGATYQAGDIAIDVATGGGNTGLLTLSKASGGPTPGVVFSANAGNFSSITFTYNVTIEPMGAAGVVFGSPFVVNLATQSHVGNGSGTVQFIVPGAPSCAAITLSGSTQDSCVIPGSQPATLQVGQIMTLSGNTGNVSIGTFTNLFNVVTALGQGLDIDGNGSYGATTDGLLVVRYLLGLRGAALISGAAVGAGATRTTSTAIQQYLANLLP